ncbi:MAG: N-acetylmuramoyl-L-alanine amidase family protein [Caulobacterales bacterium]|jgi:N-acetylmuramoyl-L-alanine amidase
MPAFLRTGVLWAVLAAAALGVAAAAAASEGARVAVAPLDAPGAARAEIRLPAPNPERAFALLDGAPRFVVDFERPLLIDGRATGSGPGAGPVLGYRFAPRGAGARIVFDLASPRVRARLDGARGGAVRIAFEHQDGGAAAAPPDDGVEPKATIPPGRKGKKTVVVDAGHGGRDPGALAASGAYEKDVTLAAALALREALEARGLRVVLTRDSDEFLELPERVRRARAADAALFISLHADSSPNKTAEGASIYTLSERGGARAKSLAPQHDWELDLPDPPKSAQVHDILLDLAQRETKNQSADFAQVAVRHLGGVAPLLPNTRRNAGFFVLLAPDVPAILLEMGFMTNAVDEKRLTNPRQRKKMMEALADAAAEFLSAPTTLADSR